MEQTDLLALAVQKVSTILWINLFLVENTTSFRNTYPLGSDLPGG